MEPVLLFDSKGVRFRVQKMADRDTEARQVSLKTSGSRLPYQPYVSTFDLPRLHWFLFSGCSEPPTWPHHSFAGFRKFGVKFLGVLLTRDLHQPQVCRFP